MKDDSPSAPPLETPRNVTIGHSQVSVPPQEPMEFLPSNDNRAPILDSDESTYFLGPNCELRVQEFKEKLLTFSCLKEHNCAEDNPSIRIMMRESHPKPEHCGEFFHLR